MTAKKVLTNIIEFARGVTDIYLSDFTDEDLLVRPLLSMNHAAWQLGHLLCSERSMMTAIGVAMPELPPEFADNYTDETCQSDDPKLFAAKAEYFSLRETSREAVLRGLEAVSDKRLAEPSPESARMYAGTVAGVFRHIGTHELMHVGQFVAIRRKLRKPTLI